LPAEEPGAVSPPPPLAGALGVDTVGVEPSPTDAGGEGAGGAGEADADPPPLLLLLLLPPPPPPLLLLLLPPPEEISGEVVGLLPGVVTGAVGVCPPGETGVVVDELPPEAAGEFVGVVDVVGPVVINETVG
jgi:hypothetical protein